MSEHELQGTEAFSPGWGVWGGGVGVEEDREQEAAEVERFWNYELQYLGRDA